MASKLILFLAIIGIASAQNLFGNPLNPIQQAGRPAPSLLGGAPTQIPNVAGNAPLDLGVAEWTKKIQDLVELVRSTLVSMGEIAVEDDPEVGAKIVTTLHGEVAKAAQILTEYTASNLSSLGRKRREVKSGNDAYNGVGDVLVKSNDKIEPDKKKLSPGAQKKINKKHKDGVDKCQADSCKAAAKTLAAADDDSERQR